MGHAVNIEPFWSSLTLYEFAAWVYEPRVSAHSSKRLLEISRSVSIKFKKKKRRSRERERERERERDWLID